MVKYTCALLTYFNFFLVNYKRKAKFFNNNMINMTRTQTILEIVNTLTINPTHKIHLFQISNYKSTY